VTADVGLELCELGGSVRSLASGGSVECVVTLRLQCDEFAAYVIIGRSESRVWWQVPDLYTHSLDSGTVHMASSRLVHSLSGLS